MLVQTATGQRPGSTLYHIGDGFYFRVNRQHLKTIYMRCAYPGCKVTGSMASDSSQRSQIKTTGQHNHPPDLYKFEIMAFSERLYQRCRVETTPLRTIFQQELVHAPAKIRGTLVMSHYLKRMQNLRKRLRAQSLRAKINLTTQDDSVLLYEDGTPIKDTVEEISSPGSSNISMQGLHYLTTEEKEEENSDLKNIDSLVVEIQSTNIPLIELQEESDDSKNDEDSTIQMNSLPKRKLTTHGFDWTEDRMNVLLEAMGHYYTDIILHKDNPKHIWEEVAKEIDPDVKWYTVKKKWTQLEDGYRTYMKDLRETGDQGLYRPAYMEEIRDIINEIEDITEICGKSQSIQSLMKLNSDHHPEIIYNNSDHMYSSMDDTKSSSTKKNETVINTPIKRMKNFNDAESLINSLLKIHREQLVESRQRMELIMSALEASRRDSREATQCIKRLTEAIIQRITIPDRIVTAQKRGHTSN